MSKNNDQVQGTEVVSKQIMLPVEQLRDRQVGVGFVAHGNVQDVRLLTEVKYRRAVQQNIKAQLEVKKAADQKVKETGEAVTKAFEALRPPKDFLSDLKSLHGELKRFFPGTPLPLFSAKDALKDDDEETARDKAGDSLVSIHDVPGKSQYAVRAAFTNPVNGNSAIFRVERLYPYTKEIEAAILARSKATVEAAAAEAKLVELRAVLAGVAAVADDAAAVVAQFNLQQSGDLGTGLLTAIGDMLEKRAKSDGIDVSAEPTALALTGPSQPTNGRSRS